MYTRNLCVELVFLVVPTAISWVFLNIQFQFNPSHYLLTLITHGKIINKFMTEIFHANTLCQLNKLSLTKSANDVYFISVRISIKAGIKLQQLHIYWKFNVDSY